MVSKNSVEPKAFLVSPENLEVGMTICQDVINHQDFIILPKGYKVHNLNKLIRTKLALKSNGIKSLIVRISDVSVGADIKQLPLSTKEKAEDANSFFENVLPQVKKSMEDIFNKIDQNIYSEIDQLKEEIEKSMDIFNIKQEVLQVIEQLKKEDKSLYMHCYSIAIVSYMVGKWLKLSVDNLKNLFLLAMVSDIGLIRVHPDLRFSPHEISEKDINDYQNHVAHSLNILKHTNFMDAEKERIIFTHHENFNKTGYPLKLDANKIPLFSRIIYISFLYTQYTLHEGCNPLKAVYKIKDTHLREVDLNILYFFEKRMYDYFIGQEVRISSKNNLLGKIIMVNLTDSSILIKAKGNKVLILPLKSLYDDSLEFV